jgi:hypothetical protein
VYRGVLLETIDKEVLPSVPSQRSIMIAADKSLTPYVQLAGSSPDSKESAVCFSVALFAACHSLLTVDCYSFIEFL